MPSRIVKKHYLLIQPVSKGNGNGQRKRIELMYPGARITTLTLYPEGESPIENIVDHINPQPSSKSDDDAIKTFIDKHKIDGYIISGTDTLRITGDSDNLEVHDIKKESKELDLELRKAFDFTVKLVHALDDAGIQGRCVCWGHQFMAIAFGGKVGPIEKKEDQKIGFYKVKRVEGVSDPVVDIVPDEGIYVAKGHKMEVKEYPSKSTPLLKSLTGRTVAARYGKNIVTFSFHPDYSTKKFLKMFPTNKKGIIKQGYFKGHSFNNPDKNIDESSQFLKFESFPEAVKGDSAAIVALIVKSAGETYIGPVAPRVLVETLWFNPTKLREGWDNFLELSDNLNKNKVFKHEMNDGTLDGIIRLGPYTCKKKDYPFDKEYKQVDYTEIKTIHVKKESQGKGIGKGLIVKMAIYAKLRGLLPLCLQTNRTNPKACAFYASLGFKFIGEKTKLFPYTEDGCKEEKSAVIKIAYFGLNEQGYKDILKGVKHPLCYFAPSEREQFSISEIKQLTVALKDMGGVSYKMNEIPDGIEITPQPESLSSDFHSDPSANSAMILKFRSNGKGEYDVVHTNMAPAICAYLKEKNHSLSDKFKKITTLTEFTRSNVHSWKEVRKELQPKVGEESQVSEAQILS